MSSPNNAVPPSGVTPSDFEAFRKGPSESAIYTDRQRWDEARTIAEAIVANAGLFEDGTAYLDPSPGSDGAGNLFWAPGTVEVAGATTTNAMTADRAIYQPIKISRPITLNEVQIEVTTADAGDPEIHLAIVPMAADRSCAGPPVWEGEADASTTGVKLIAADVVIPPGFYYTVAVTAGAPTLEATRLFLPGWASFRNGTAFRSLFADVTNAGVNGFDGVVPDPTSFTFALRMVLLSWT